MDETTSEATSLLIRGEAADDPTTFAAQSFDVSSRAMTTASVAWSPPAWDSINAAGSAQQTPDLKAVVQEIVDRDGWSAASSMAFIITGSGKRVAEAYDGNQSAAPLSHIEFTTAPPATTFYAIEATDAVKAEEDAAG